MTCDSEIDIDTDMLIKSGHISWHILSRWTDKDFDVNHINLKKDELIAAFHHSLPIN